MKYRIDFPIRKDCALKCFYCFHTDYFNRVHPYDKEEFGLGFTLNEWALWRNKFLKNSEEILLNFHGGEPFHPNNVTLIKAIFNNDINDVQTYDLLSNGLSEIENYYSVIIGNEKKIKRIGFTFHREIIKDNKQLINKFEKTVLLIKRLGISVYVKELLRVKDRKLILANKKYWKDTYNIELKIQDYKGDIKGASYTEYNKYSALDHKIIDEEYKHKRSEFCSCMKGYRTFGIRGYDQYSGNVVACWLDPVIVGNIKGGWFNNNFKIDRVPGTSIRNVIGVPKKYSGTFHKDREDIKPELCKH